MELKVEPESLKAKAVDSLDGFIKKDESKEGNQGSVNKENQSIQAKGKKKANKKKIIEELENLLHSFPDSPRFIGKIYKFRKGWMDRLFNTGEYSKLKSMRVKVSNLAEKNPKKYKKERNHGTL